MPWFVVHVPNAGPYAVQNFARYSVRDSTAGRLSRKLTAPIAESGVGHCGTHHTGGHGQLQRPPATGPRERPQAP